MPYKQDWIMRQIESMARFVANVIFKKESLEYEIFDENNQSQTDDLYYELKGLIAQRKFCEAEDLLYENFNPSDVYLTLCVDFYQTLNGFEDEVLEENNFSRAEISEGFNDILKKFNINLADI